MVEVIARLARPWADLYGASLPLEATVVFLHLAALVVAGGLAIASDRAIVRAGGAGEAVRAHALAEVAGAHSLVLIGLGVLIATGILMLLADVEALLPSWLFWLKMLVFMMLLGNGARLRQVTERARTAAAGAGWRPVRSAAMRSSALWLVLLLIGTLLPLVA